MMLSIIFPSKRPEHAKRVVESIRDTIGHYPYEILIPSRTSIPYTIQVPEADYFEGLPVLYKRAYDMSRGKYIFITSDSFVVEPNFFCVIDYMENQDMSQRRFKIATLEHRGHPHYGIQPEGWVILGCPIMARETIDKELDGWPFCKHFKYHCMDNWLTYFIGKLDKPAPVITITGLHRFSNNPDNTQHNDFDKAMFEKLKREFIGTYN